MASGDETRGRGAGRPAVAGLAAIGALTLGLVVWGVLAQRGYAVLPRGVQERLLPEQTVDGYAARTPEELGHLLRRKRPQDPVTLRTRDGPRVVTLAPEVSGAVFVVTLLSALAFWAVCMLALAPRIRRPGIADLFVGLLLGALWIAIGGTSPPRGVGGYVLSLLYLASPSLAGPFFVRFTLAFPRPAPDTVRTRWLGWTLLGCGLAVATWAAVTWLQAMAAPGASGIAATAAPGQTLILFLVLCLALACAALYRSSRTARLDRERRQAKWILWGLALGAAPYVVLRALPRALLDWEPPWDPGVDRVVEMAIPLTLAIAVARERFLDIDLIIRRSILYTLLALGAAAVFFGTAVSLAGLVASGLGLPDDLPPWVYAVAGVVTGLLFQPGRRAIGRWVDRTFFRMRHSYDEALATLEGDLASAGGQREVAARLCAFLERALAPKTSGARVRSGDGWERCGAFADVPDELLESVTRPGTLVARPDATGAPELESADWPEALGAAGVRLVQPIRADGRTLGVLLVGEKRTERHYLQEDLAALGAAADRAGIQLERLALVQQVAEEALAHRALAELTREKTEFFARLAHDLRTPITAVRWSVQNLLDGLPGPLTERQTQYLQGVGAAAGQLARLVENLVDLGRLDLAAPRPPDEAVDLAAVVDEVASALAVVARERRATIEVEAAPGLPAVRGSKTAAFQIVINLVDNALRYTAPDTAVKVALHEDEQDGHVVLRVRDHGPGLPEDRAGLFELFRQGPESPHVQAKGFGIGLHIVRTWTEALGGSVEGDNAPDGGARFTCRLPRWRGEESG